MMAPLCQAQLVLALEDTPDSQAVLLRMVGRALGLWVLMTGPANPTLVADLVR